jgi:hypothetical protein
MQVQLSHDDLAPLVEQVVQATLQRLDADRARFNGRLAYSEPEAAAALGVAPHVLRDARLRGLIRAVRLGKSYRYAADELRRFLREGGPAT